MGKFVIDTNRVFSALLRDGSTRVVILQTEADLFAPLYAREEIDRYLPEIARRAGHSRDQLNAILEVLAARITWVPPEDYRAHMGVAKRAIGETDPKDVPLLACALAIGADAIWSLDLDFDEQNLVPRIPHPDAASR